MNGLNGTFDSIIAQSHRASSAAALVSLQAQAFAPAMDAKAELLAEVSQTTLGVNLLKFLREHDFDILIRPIWPSLGRMYGSARKIYLDGSLTLTERMHVFAHEARHAAQYLADETKCERAASRNPLSALYSTRLAEMDAEAFAVFFVHNHTRKTGQSFFNELSGERNTSRAAMVGDQLLYLSFAESLQEGGAAAGMRAAYLAYPLFEARAHAYNRFSLKGWRDGVWKPLHDHIDAPCSKFAREFRESLSRPQSCAELIAGRARTYSGLFNSWGVPDYLAGLDETSYVSCIGGRLYPAPLGDDERLALKAARRDFRRISVRYAVQKDNKAWLPQIKILNL